VALSLPENSNVGVVSGLAAAGFESIVVSGAWVSIVHVQTAGSRSTFWLSDRSVASTSNL
jgi:hypothetical protein